MSRRFQQVNKYRNAVGTLGKKELWYADVPAEKASDVGQGLAASSTCLAIKWTGSGSLGLLPINALGKGCASQAVVFHAHPAALSDWTFSPFDDQLLATAAEDATVKLWRLQQDDLQPTCASTLACSSRYAAELRFHPGADHILGSLGNDGKQVAIWDVDKQTRALALDGAFHSFAWSGQGDRIATSGQGTVQIWDPRATDQLVQSGKGHEAIKGSRVAWLGETPHLFSVGMNKMRSRQYCVWDSRNMAQPVVMNHLDTSSGTLLPLYDQDTETMYLVSRGDATIRALQFDATFTNPTVAENMACGTSTSVLGAALLPKTALDVMHTEIARLLALTPNGVIPISYNVPRKQYLDFHAELYPDTNGQIPALTSEEWLNGKTGSVAKVPLDPKKRDQIKKKPVNSSISSAAPASLPASATAVATTTATTTATRDAPSTATIPAPAPASPAPVAATADTLTDVTGNQKPASPNPVPSEPVQASVEPIKAEEPKATREKEEKEPVKELSKKPAVPVVYGTPHASVFKYLATKGYHPSTHFTDLKELDASKGASVILVQANERWVAVPLSGPGGRVGVVSTAKPGRLPAHLPAIATGSDIAFFVFDPFDDDVLTTVSIDSKLRLYRIPAHDAQSDDKDGEERVKSLAALTPFAELHDSAMDKVAILAYHPSARNILASASHDLGKPTIRVWNVSDASVAFTLRDAHADGADTILSMAWSPNGKALATVSKDKKLRIIDARTGQLLQKGAAHALVRPSRLAWVDDTYIVSVGFGIGCYREILLFDATNLDKPIAKHLMEMSPGVMDIHVDRDCQILYVCGRGDRIIHAFAVDDSSKVLTPLTKLEFGSLQQGFAFLPKQMADIKEVELQKYYRLTPNAIELVGARIPRARPEFFQDDIFVPTLDTTTPALDAAAWCKGDDTPLNRISLQPEGMTPLSEAPPPASAARAKSKFEKGRQQVSLDEQRENSMRRMFASAKDVDLEEEQRKKMEAKAADDHEDVAEDEWDD
ncbi:hypothetical protein BC940DRAFT_90171 [Gongronella butleri]|nr:hypothetical protein BC940DRAFT_90171 [Gongronella butleri]